MDSGRASLLTSHTRYTKWTLQFTLPPFPPQGMTNVARSPGHTLCANRFRWNHGPPPTALNTCRCPSQQLPERDDVFLDRLGFALWSGDRVGERFKSSSQLASFVRLDGAVIDAARKGPEQGI